MVKQQLASLTLVPDFGEIRRGRLHEQTLPSFRVRVSRLLRRSTTNAGIACAVGINLSSHEAGLFEPYWQLYAHLLSSPLTDAEIAKIRRWLGPPSPAVCSRLIIEQATDEDGWVAHLAKVAKRERVLPAEKNRPPEYRKLQEADAEELWGWVQKYELAQWFFLINT